jgi:hypothetical protein
MRFDNLRIPIEFTQLIGNRKRGRPKRVRVGSSLEVDK